MTAERQKLARRAEQCVAQYLRDQGFSIVARNLRLGPLEIDIVARHAELIVLVEVRSRGPNAWTTGHGSVTSVKRERLRRAARRLWRARYACDSSVSRLRIDVAAVSFIGGVAQVDYSVAAITC